MQSASYVLDSSLSRFCVALCRLLSAMSARDGAATEPGRPTYSWRATSTFWSGGAWNDVPVRREDKAAFASHLLCGPGGRYVAAVADGALVALEREGPARPWQRVGHYLHEPAPDAKYGAQGACAGCMLCARRAGWFATFTNEPALSFGVQVHRREAAAASVTRCFADRANCTGVFDVPLPSALPASLDPDHFVRVGVVAYATGRATCPPLGLELRVCPLTGALLLGYVPLPLEDAKTADQAGMLAPCANPLPATHWLALCAIPSARRTRGRRRRRRSQRAPTGASPLAAACRRRGGASASWRTW